MTAKEWNAIHPVGSRVHYYPFLSDGPATDPEHNAFHFDTRTSAPAFDGPCGPVVRLAHYGIIVSVDRLHVVGRTAPQVQSQPDYIMDWRRGFTILELSVVLAIVAVVSVLAFPTFFGWMDRERFRGEVREFAEAVKAERSWAAMNLPSGIIVDEWGYTVARRGESPVVHDYADGISATSNLITPIVRIDSYGGAQFETPADEKPDGTEIQQPARVAFTDGKHTMTVEITLGGQAVLAGGAE